MRPSLEDFLDENTSEPVIGEIALMGENTDEKFEEVTEDVELAGEMVGTAVALEQMIVSIRQNGLPDKASRVYLHQAIQGQLSKLGLEQLYIRPSFENYEELSEDEVVASLENIVTKLWNSVANMSSKTWKGISDFFKDFVEDVYEIASKAEHLKRELQRREDMPSKAEIEISQAHYLHLSGRTDKEAIIKGFENLCKVNRETFPKYLDNVKKFYDAYFKAYQALLGRVHGIEVYVTMATAADEFIKQVNRDLELVLNTDQGRLEISGGRVFDSRNMLIKGLPELMLKNYNLKVDSYQTIKTPSKKELNHLLDLIISNADVIKSYWKRYNDVTELLRKARADAAEDSENIDNLRLFKLLARVQSHMQLSISQFNLLQPLNALAWHTLHVSRSLLRVCNKAVEAHRVSI